MKKSELQAITDKLDGWIEAVENDPDSAGHVYPELLTARLIAEQTMILAQVLTMLRKLPDKLDEHEAAVVDAVVQRTWPGVIAFEEDKDE